MNKSEDIRNLAKALVEFQAEVKNPANTAINPHFKSKYAPLNEILNEVRPKLAKHGLSVLQSPSGDGEKIVIKTLLMHTSGEWIEGCPLTLRADRPTAQGAGSAITYGRRYALSAILGISSEDDDDGNNAEPKTEQKNTQKQELPKAPQQPQKPEYQPPPQQTADPISEPQRKKIYAMTKKIGLQPDDVKTIMQERYGVSESKALTKKQATDFIEYLGKLESGELTWTPKATATDFDGQEVEFNQDEIPFD